MAEGGRGASSLAAQAEVPAFVRGLSFEDLPGDVVASVRRNLLDLIGVAAAGSRTQAAAIASAYAATQLCGSEIIQVSMSHRVAPDLEAQRAKFTQLCCRHITRFVEESRGHVEGSMAAIFLQDGSSRSQICLAAVVEGDSNRLAGGEA